MTLERWGLQWQLCGRPESAEYSVFSPSCPVPRSLAFRACSPWLLWHLGSCEFQPIGSRCWRRAVRRVRLRCWPLGGPLLKAQLLGEARSHSSGQVLLTVPSCCLFQPGGGKGVLLLVASGWFPYPYRLLCICLHLCKHLLHETLLGDPAGVSLLIIF